MSRLASGFLLLSCVGLSWVGGSAAVARGHVRDPRAERGRELQTGAVSPEGEHAWATDPGRTWADDHVAVAPRREYPLAEVAASLGSRVLRDVGPAGYALLEIPAGLDREGFLRVLRRDGRIAHAAPDGIVHGSADVYLPGQVTPVQRTSIRARWHIVASNLPETGDAKGIVVALLDTGVAFEDRTADGVDYRRAPSLASVGFVSPWDFINGDAHPNDDHQHGTHLASLIAAAGTYPGIAPGVSIMPIKVLDRDNVGTEIALVDGIVHAVTHGADIINMSLSFGRAYVPSRMLVDALERAAAAGAVLVAAAGNDGGDYVSQPAANPLVIAVGANRPEGVEVYGAAPYSNASPRVDLMAPGGSVDEDRDGDGLLDGVIGETIALGDPSRTGYWLYAGTSQATALVSGAAARLLADGRRPDEIRVLLQGSAAVESYIRTAWVDGRGRGRLDVTGALALGRDPTGPAERELSVAILGWLAPGPDTSSPGEAAVVPTVRPAARLTVLDEQLKPMPWTQVVGMFSGTADTPFSCLTTADGTCLVVGPSAPAADSSVWTITADDVVIAGVSHHPRTALFASDGLQALLHEMRDNQDLLGTVPAWRWRPQVHPALGPVAASFVIGNLGTGIATSPQVMVATPGAMGRAGVLASGAFEVSGGGPASHPVALHARTAPRCEAGPAGWEVLHLPESDLTVFVLDATGLVSTSLALGAAELAGLGATSCALQGQPFVVSVGGYARRGGAILGDQVGTPIADWLAEGGWTTPNGEPAATAIAATVAADGAHGRLAGSGRAR
ncbi:MAG: S8 family serine peptidase [Pseudomonadota bacterium]|nr:S8 family serine peptidase [Pseudomonadota bacterium]